MDIADPRNYPWPLNSPYEIYAAGRWFGSREDQAWQNRARRWAGQNSPVFRGEPLNAGIPAASLVRDLFFLHLTVRTASREIHEALGLLKSMVCSQDHRGLQEADIPFEPAEDPDFVRNAWLFSAAVFGEADSPCWRESAEKAGKLIQTGGGNFASGRIYNFLRGTLIVPEAEKIPGVFEAIRLLSARQDSSGYWKDLAPWQVYNLMAHSAHPEALKILDRLESPLLEQQNPDGSWGSGEQKNLAAFLMAHGLQNRGKIKKFVPSC